MIGVTALPVSELTDRVDLLRRPQGVVQQRVTGYDEVPVSFDIPCKILNSSTGRFASMFGLVQEAGFVAYLPSGPVVQQNDVLRVSGTNYRYTVKIVRKYPSPHDCQFQVVELAEDQAAAGKPTQTVAS